MAACAGPIAKYYVREMSTLLPGFLARLRGVVRSKKFMLALLARGH